MGTARSAGSKHPLAKVRAVAPSLPFGGNLQQVEWPVSKHWRPNRCQASAARQTRASKTCAGRRLFAQFAGATRCEKVREWPATVRRAALYGRPVAWLQELCEGAPAGRPISEAGGAERRPAAVYRRAGESVCGAGLCAALGHEACASLQQKVAAESRWPQYARCTAAAERPAASAKLGELASAARLFHICAKCD